MTRRASRLASFVAAAALSAAAGAVAAAEGRPALGPPPDGLAAATFAAGCFWCVEEAFDHVDGVERTISGYTGGSVARPTYGQVSSGGTGHTEAVRVVYDPERVDYARLLEVFWHNVDPLDAGGQFCDRGSQYRSAIFVHSEEQRRLAESSRASIADSGRFEQPIVTPIESAAAFYPAEKVHQGYYEKNPLRYKFYRYGCGRDARLEELWGESAGG